MTEEKKLEYLYKIVERNDNDTNFDIAKAGYCLDVLVHNDNVSIREEVAKHGYGLDILINDERASVRECVAKQGYGLDVLVNDKNAAVRLQVATYAINHPDECIHLIEILSDDPMQLIRACIASAGYFLDKFVNDKSIIVRGIVASQGYEIDTLINDLYPEVVHEIANYLIEL